MKKRIFLLFIRLMAVVLPVAGFSQGIPDDLQVQIKEKGFYEAKNAIENYYKTAIKRMRTDNPVAAKLLLRQRKLLNRHFYMAEGRLNEQGKVENSTQKIFDYLSSGSTMRTEAASGDWSLVGPNYVQYGVGRINRIAFHPTNSFKIYAGSAGGGLFVSDNGGVSWSNLAGFMPSLGISGIVVSHANANVIYVLTGDGDAMSGEGFNFSFGYIRYSVGVLKSTDGGNTWQKTGDFPGLAGVQYAGMKLIQDPNNSNVLLAATTHGLYRTTDGGNTWAVCDMPDDDVTMVYDIEYRPGSSATVYASIRRNNATSNGQFVRSTNSGVTFTQVSTFSPDVFTSVQRIEIGVTAASPGVVYLVAGPATTSSYRGVWRSADNGVTFTRQHNTPNILGAGGTDIVDQNLYDLAIAVSPTSAATIITGGLVVFRSTNSGSLFWQATGYHGDPYIHPDIHDLAYNPLDGKLYAATDGGVASSTDNGLTWVRNFVGLSCTQFYHFSLQDDGGDLWGGTQDNGILVQDGQSTTFERYHGGDGFDVLTDMAPAGNQDDKYFSVNEKVYADATPDVDITPPGADNFFANLGMHSVDEDIIYAGYENLYISYNRGDDWSSVMIGNDWVPGNWALETCPSLSTRIYTAGKNGRRSGFFRIDGIGFNIEARGLTPSTDYSGDKITDIAVHPGNANRVWISVGGYAAKSKVFYSSDGGSTWSNWSNSLPNLPVNCIVADENGNVYVGTDVGVFYRGSGDKDWTPFYNKLPRVAVTELELLKVGGTSIAIYGSTFGRGIWKSSVFSSCSSTLTVSSTLQGQQFFQAGSTLTSTSLINGAAGTSVFFKAGSSVTLTPGFSAVSGTEFQSYIGPCNTGGVPARIVTLPEKEIKTTQ